MEFRVLGALEAGSGGTVVELGPPKQRALLAILLLHVGEIVPVDRLIDLLWGEDPPRTAGHSIQIYVSELRKALEPLAGERVILRRPPGYQLDTPAESVDAKRFETLVQQGSAQLSAGERDEAIRTLRSALELWRGPALSDFAYEEFAQPYVRRFHDLHLDAIETLAAAELDSGQAASVVPLVEAAIREDPLRERSRELLMIALYRSGRHAEALRSYENLREMLVEELGLEPSPPLQQLRDRVLLHDPSLLPTPTRAPVRGAARNPYKGLQPFGEEDAEDFFGRDALVERLLTSLADGQRMIGLVGPSGSGKSSIVAAGLIPRLRRGGVPGSDRWIIVPVPLGPDPLADLQAVLARIGPGRSAAGKRLNGGHLVLPPVEEGTRVVLVVDQFEQLFTAAEESRRNQFLKVLAAALEDGDGPIVILTLRADYYDRPLQHPEFSEAFVPGVVHVLPMSAREIEAAVVEPAERVGVTIESKLLAELVAETVARPGSLPLLQYALTELFEQRTEPMLTLAGYAALGGLRGVLSRRAEATFLGLGPDEQRIAIQVFLRLVRLGRGTADSRRRLMVSELTDLGIDAVALSSVLTAFGRHRLLTFDHDELSGQATVELAHEALLTEWERLAGWIDRHRAALRRRDALLAAVDEWELSGRDPEYLLGGSRLAELEEWSREGSLHLTTGEREFLEAGVERRQAAGAEEDARLAEHRQLARKARMRLVGLAAAGLAAVGLGGAVVWGIVAAPPPPPAPVAYMWFTEGLVSVQAVAGFDRAVTDFGLVSQKFHIESLFARLEGELGTEFWLDMTDREVDAHVGRAQEEHLRSVVTEGAGLIVVENMWVPDLEAIAREFPETKFAIGAPGEGVPNMAYLTPVDAEPSYLAGAAAALTSESGTIGYIGGVDWDGIWGFWAGYEAGARAIDPDIEILVEHLSVDDFTGFDDVDGARAAALLMYGNGADVIFHAAGDSGLGLFEAATTYTREEGRHVWAIGVDSDQYETVQFLPGATNSAAWQAHILTSVLKPIEEQAYTVVAEYAQGEFTPGSWNWGLESGASGLSYSGGYIDALQPTIEDLKAKIIAGEIVVPCIPEDRLDEAASMGIGPDDCRIGLRRDVEAP
jgi:basic membrane lipoprotein Med (substrate-binding protein (PBP1-ABC) superfamily)/DNA-binding SARP family transcriptional activator